MRRDQVFAVDGSGLFQPARAAGHRRHRAPGRDLRSGGLRRGLAARLLDAGRLAVAAPDAVPRDLRLPVVRQPAHAAGAPTTSRAGRSSARPASARPATTASVGTGSTRRWPNGAPRPRAAVASGAASAVACGRAGAPRNAAPPPTPRPAAIAAPRCSPTTRRAPPNTTTGTCAAAEYARGPIHDTAWNAELDAAGRWLDDQPLAGEIVEPAAGTGWWSPLLAGKGELSLYDGTAAPLDRARERLRRARPPRAPPRPRRRGRRRIATVDARLHRLLAQPRPARPARRVPRHRPAAGSSPAGRFAFIDAARSAVERRGPSGAGRRTSLRRLARRARVHGRQGLLRAGRARGRAWPAPASSRRRSTTTGRFFLTGMARAAASRVGMSPATPERDLSAAILRRRCPPWRTRTIATVGSGVMAEAMIAGLLRGKLVAPGPDRGQPSAGRAARCTSPASTGSGRSRPTSRRSTAADVVILGDQAPDARARSAARSARTCARASSCCRVLAGRHDQRPSPGPSATTRSCAACRTPRPGSARA